MADQTFESMYPFLSPERRRLEEHEAPLMPGSKIENRIDRHDRHLHRHVAEEDPGLPSPRPSARNPEPFPYAADLEKRLREVIEGEVRFDRGSRAMYSTDASNYRQVPIGVVVPKSDLDIVKTVSTARSFSAPILSRGGGTSLAGQCCNTAVVMDMSKHYNRVLEINPQQRYAIVEPGIVLDELRKAVKPHGLTFGPDPATHSHCTLGGMVGNNSCGMHAQKWGRTEANVDALEILTYDGQRFWVGPTSDEEFAAIQRAGGRRAEIYRDLRKLRDRYADQVRTRFPKIPRKVSGYNLDELLPESGFNVARALVGTESTCVTILKAKLRLVPDFKHRTLVLLGFRDIFTAADYIPDINRFQPIGFEGMDETLIEHMQRKGLEKDDMFLLPEGKGWLVIEFGADDPTELKTLVDVFAAAAEKFEDKPDLRVISKPDEQKRIWAIREAGLGATARVPGERETWEGWEDSAVAPDRLADYLRAIQKLYDDFGYTGALYGHFGQGCLHTRIDFDLQTKAGIEKYREFVHEAAHLVVSFGGSLSGEHGDGQSRGELLPIMFGTDLVQAFREFKGIWDPAGLMNPGKIVDPYRVDQNLRIGTEYAPPVWDTHFHFPEDHGSFVRATTRCVGVGECRRHEGGVMCPSYMVTREEMHSTRGRARLLFEMLEGNPLHRSWKEEKVKEALDLCLACKGCKGDCPVNVDMATYKAEFLSHYYKGRLRPLTAYSMGLIYWWARLASLVPRLANWISSSRWTGGLFKRLGGIAPQRTVPKFAGETFRQWFDKRKSSNGFGPRVILWADTFNNHFHPKVAMAAVEVLEAAGFHVELPPKGLCCGRPLYDHGMLDLAKRQLRQILAAMAEDIRAGVPIVGLEPSCTAVFRDELGGLFPFDVDAQRLKAQVYLLPEFISEYSENFEGVFRTDVQREVLMHVHCHQHAVLGAKADVAALEKLGCKVNVLDSGCCGMAGSFGFERDHYDVSVKVGERVLIPAVRAAEASTAVVTNGFSCREQIEQMAGRQPFHIAEVLRDAIVTPQARRSPI